nr:hypothetical protein [Tanacetum cinerariifolium]
MWSDQEKRVQKIDHLVRSLLIQGLSNDIYSLIDRNKTAKDIWDALARHMLCSVLDLDCSEVMEIVIPKVGGIADDIPLTIEDDNLREKLLNVYLLIANIEALKDNPTQSFELLTNILGNLKTLAKGFYPPSLKFLSFNWESCIIILSTNVILWPTS